MFSDGPKERRKHRRNATNRSYPWRFHPWAYIHDSSYPSRPDAFYQKLGDRRWEVRTWLLVGNVQNSGWIAFMDKIIFTLNSQKKLDVYSPNGWGYRREPLCLFQMHLLVPVPSTLAARSKIKNQVITPQGRTWFLVVVRCILAFGSKNNHDVVDSCQRDRRTGTHPTCALVPVLHRPHCQIPTSYCRHWCTCGSTESTCSILEWWRKLGCRSLGYHASLQR